MTYSANNIKQQWDPWSSKCSNLINIVFRAYSDACCVHTLKISQVWRISDSTKQICNICGLDWFSKNDACLRPVPPLRESSCRAVQHRQPVKRLWNTSDWTKKQRHHDQPTEATTKTWRILRWKQQEGALSASHFLRLSLRRGASSFRRARLINTAWPPKVK